MPSPNYKLIDKDKDQKEMMRKIKALNGVKIKIGLWGSGSPKQNVAYRMAIHEYGSSKRNIPSRPWAAQAFELNKNKLFSFIDINYKKMLRKKITLDKFLKKIAVLHEGQMKKSIISRLFWTLKKSTITRKKSSTQLVDTAVSLNSIKSKIGKGL